MDPITSGTAIFKSISDKFGNSEITRLPEINKFFTQLIEDTKGWVILDFLDTANWDKIEAYSLDEENGILTLIWHDYRNIEESDLEKEMRQMAFPASLYAAGIAVKSIVPITGEKSAVFLLNGYSKTEKEIKKLYRVDGPDFKLYDNRFFEKRVVRKVDNNWEVTDFHCTPIYSLAIIPKNSGLSSFDSKKLLYQYNIQEALKRVATVVDSLEEINATDHDLICEKVNTARRVLELVLKIECCYRDIEVKESYSQVLLGPLLNYVKRARDSEFNTMFGKMAELLNEFSHDSGKEVDLAKGRVACMLVMAYTKLLQLEIK
jgi:hypothetical protein